MTKAELHETPAVKTILVSPELNKICCHLREHIPFLTDKTGNADEMINNGGKVLGWLKCVEALRDLKNLDEPGVIEKVTTLYGRK